MVRIVAPALSVAAIAMPLSNAAAVPPPPPPPAYVIAVADLLTQDEGADTIKRLSSSVANDVRAYVNDKLVADGKSDWLRYYGSMAINRRVLAYSATWQPNGSTLMVVDQFDVTDRSKAPSDFFLYLGHGNSATLYQFGSDHKIHLMRTILGGGFWTRP